ncbi:MAG: sigma-70 family RNA polymerase sigma factor [Deltaproteobacteria bacterium]|nr:sigma-70 family RNA polymerase sigma factor [Deltaproteobacteria bacterium]
MASTIDTTLIDAARNGDPIALSEVLSAVQNRVYRFGMKMCRDPHDAEEVLQETLIAMAKGLPEFRGESSISSWAYAIARSFCIKQRRRSKFAPEHETSIEQEGREEARAIADTTSAPDNEAEGRELRALLDEAISELDPMYREVLVLRDVEGLTAPEVGEVMGLTVAAVKSRLHRARKTLRELVEPILEEAPQPGTACPDTATLFSEHIEGELDSEACARMEAHLDECGSCRSTCDSLREILQSCRMTPTPTVPDDLQEAVRRAVEAYLSTL